MSSGEAVEEEFGGGQIVGLEVRLGGEIFGIIGERLAGDFGSLEVAYGLGKFSIGEVSVAEGEVGGGGGFAGVRLGIGGDTRIGSGAAHHGEFLGHGAELGRGYKCGVQRVAFGEGPGGERGAFFVFLFRSCVGAVSSCGGVFWLVVLGRGLADGGACRQGDAEGGAVDLEPLFVASVLLVRCLNFVAAQGVISPVYTLSRIHSPVWNGI